MTKSIWRRKGFISSNLYPSSREVRERTWNQELIQRSWRSAANWNCSPWLAEPVFLQYQGPQPRGGTAHSDILLHLIINQENALGLPIGQSGRGTLSIEVPNTSLCQANTKLYVSVCSKESAGWLLHAGWGGIRQKRTSRGIWMCSEQIERHTDWTWPELGKQE